MSFTAMDLPPQQPTQAFHCDLCSCIVLIPDLHAEVCQAQLVVDAPPVLPTPDPVQVEDRRPRRAQDVLTDGGA